MSTSPTVYLISTNDEVLEHLRDQVQQQNGVPESETVFSYISSSSIQLCVCSLDTVLLIGRTVNEEAESVIANVCRMRLEWKSTGRLIVAKYELSDSNKAEIQELFEKSRQAWLDLWNEELARLRTLRSCKPLRERMEAVETWLLRGEVKEELLVVEASKLEKELRSKFAINGPYRLSPVLGPSLALKPPALHWASWPHEGELQMALRTELPENCVTEEFFRDLTNKAKETFSWEYVYDWVSGVFLKQGEVKIVVSEQRKTTVEIAARVDMDELEEDHDKAMRSVWPLFAPVVECFAQRISEIPHTMYLVVIGASFFSKPVVHNARAFEMTELLCALNIARNVVFRIGEDVIRLQVDGLFPGRRPKVTRDLWSPDVRIEVVSSPTTPMADETRNFVIEENRAFNDDSPMLLSAMKSKQKGRRVSFGAIRLLSSLGDDMPISTAFQVESPILEDHSVITEYVDHMLNEILRDTVALPPY
ncbi:hypothetical protein L596_004261 [Steinernema carpocapsae]|uniref:Uncharacterized protein n=1 Tax=Steinernema carpocapsae TaxID=34508 RepID=A0A4U8UV90_STECR|nr:hypothetical protein L596_004261 [Steinernema carpocapsae]